MNDSLDLRQYIAIGLKWWWLIALSAILAGTASYVISSRQTPVYQASTTLIVGQTMQAIDPTRNDILLSQQLAQTYADMARRQPVLQGVVKTLNLPDSWQVLKEQVRVNPVRDTQLLEITVEAHSPEEARLIADEIAHQLILLSPTNLRNAEQNENRIRIQQRIEDLQAKIKAGQERLKTLGTTMEAALSADQVEQLQSEVNRLEGLISGWEDSYTQLLIFIESEKSPNYLAIIEPAQADSIPIRPRILIDTVLAAVVGLLLSLGMIFLLEYLDDTLKAADDLSQVLGLVPLGVISRMHGKNYQDKQVAFQDPFSPIAETYRMIRSNIEFMSVDQPVKSIVVTSANPGEGKSTTTANLGVIMAMAGLKTIIVDADLRRPALHQIFQVPNLGGLTELLRASELGIENHLRKTMIENLHLITSGVLPPNPAELLGSQRMRQLLASLDELADIVICDTAPVLMVTDAAVLSNRLDGTVLVIDAGRTRRDAAKQAIANLQRADAHLLGAVLNRVSKKKSGYYYQGGYYRTSSRSISTDQPATPGRLRSRWQWLPFFK